MAWDDRLSWSGETPLDYPHLNPVAALRLDGGDLVAGEWSDAVDPENTWTVAPWAGSNHAVAPGPWGTMLGLNVDDPATEQGVLTMPYFDGLWPSSGKLLMGLWVRQSYTMTFNPLMNTRSGVPVAYLSTYTTGRLRHDIYGSGGSAVLSGQYEDSPWGATTDWQWVAVLVDFDAQTSQIAAVSAPDHAAFLAPVRSLSGTPNTACTAPLEVFALPHAGYYSGGNLDEVFVAHPGDDFDFAEYVEAVRLGTWARGADEDSAPLLAVADDAVNAVDADTLHTGAEVVSWTERPESSIDGAVPYWSADDGDTWSTGTLPATFTGLLRWDVPLTAGDVFTGLELLPPPPTVDAIADQAVLQRSEIDVPLSGSWTDPVTWSVAAEGVGAEVDGSTLTISTGWASGDIDVVVTVRDQWDRIASSSFTLSVTPQPWSPPPPPQYPRTPIIVGDEGDAEAIIDPLTAAVVKEVNGEHTLTFSVPVRHPRSGSVRNERLVEQADDAYRVRRVTTQRQRGTPVLDVYCEALFYDLAYAGQLDAREFLQTPAGSAMEEALDGTGWTLGAVNVTTRRTYSAEEQNPLARLRLIQQQHGGDLLFDNRARTVSLVVQSGRDNGVAFTYGRGLSGSKRVSDTTSLVTRIYARNADGVTIADVNGGLPYVEDYTWTDETRTAVYDFASGVSPFTMLSTTQATLAKRSKPAFSYEFTVADLSHFTGQAVDGFDVGDLVTVVDAELGIREAQRILKVEHDVARPWASKITLSGKLRELGSRAAAEASAFTTGASFSAFDLVPYNLLRNGRFDNLLAHWASSGVSVVDGEGTGDYAVRFEGSGVRWIEQTVQPDNRDAYALSMNVSSGTAGVVPNLKAIATVQYEDGTTDTIPIDLA